MGDNKRSHFFSRFAHASESSAFIRVPVSGESGCPCADVTACITVSKCVHVRGRVRAFAPHVYHAMS